MGISLTGENHLFYENKKNVENFQKCNGLGQFPLVLIIIDFAEENYFH